MGGPTWGPARPTGGYKDRGSPACTWAAPALKWMSPNFLVTSGNGALALGLSSPSVHQGSHLSPLTPLQRSPPTGGLAPYSLLAAQPPQPRDKLTPALAGPAPRARNQARLRGPGGRGRRASPRTSRPSWLFVSVTSSVFKARPAAAALSGSPFLCLRAPPPLAPPPTGRAARREIHWPGLSRPCARSQAAPRLVCQPLRPDYLETPISKRHLNSDVNELIRCVNELKATQIKLMQ